MITVSDDEVISASAKSLGGAASSSRSLSTHTLCEFIELETATGKSANRIMRESLTLHQLTPSRSIDVVFLLKNKTAGFFTIFQSARLRKQMGRSVEGSGPQLEFLDLQKFRRLPMQLAEKVTEPIDAIIRLPSDHGWQAEPYHAALLEKFPKAVDLTDRLSRSGDHRSNLDATMPQIRKSYNYRSKGDEGSFRSLLIVDDTLRTGNSVATVIEALVENGLRNDCPVILACPLWIIPKEQQPPSTSN